MADDIRTDDFEDRSTGENGSPVRTRAAERGGPAVNGEISEQREKGDADDLAEAILNTDAQRADFHVATRNDAPVDLTRVELEESA